MTRSFSTFVVSVVLASAFPLAAAAATSGDVGPSAVPARPRMVVVAVDDDAKKDAAPVASARSGGTIDGQVTAIDYRSGTMSVSAGSRKVDVTILPSTNIQGPNNGFRTIADIQRGSHVRVLLSQRAGLYTAQIITLR